MSEDLFDDAGQIKTHRTAPSSALSTVNAQIGREFFETFSAGEHERSLGFLDPNAVWHAREDEPDSKPHHGPDAIWTDLWKTWLDVFPDLRVDRS